MLDNVGGQPVRILAAESGCGCARPVVRPELVAPGQAAVVEVTAMTIPVGEKVVRINLRTDSPTKPEVALTLKLVGTRKPPFLFMLEGEAVFRGDYSRGMSREIAVLTVENREQGASPRVSTDLPFLRLTPNGVNTKPYVKPGTFLRKWKYLVEITDRPPSGSFSGTVRAKSPWDSGETLSFNVMGQLQSGLRAFPSIITLDGSGRSASLLVVCGSPTSRLDLEEQPPRVPLVVEDEGGDGARRVHRVTIGLGKAHASGDVHTKITLRHPGTAEELTVPVVITAEQRVSINRNH